MASPNDSPATNRLTTALPGGVPVTRRRNHGRPPSHEIAARSSLTARTRPPSGPCEPQDPDRAHGNEQQPGEDQHGPGAPLRFQPAVEEAVGLRGFLGRHDQIQTESYVEHPEPVPHPSPHAKKDPRDLRLASDRSRQPPSASRALVLRATSVRSALVPSR